jgi:hypothetical protein
MAGFLSVIPKAGIVETSTEGSRQHVICAAPFSAFGEKCRVDYKPVVDVGMIEILWRLPSTLRNRRHRPYRLGILGNSV